MFEQLLTETQCNIYMHT